MLGAAFTSWTTPAGAAGSCPGGQPCVVVHVVGEDPSEQTFSVDDLDRLTDVSDADYAVRVSSDSPTSSERVGRGVSVAGLLGALDTPLAGGSVNGTSATRRDGTGSTLSRADLDDPPPFDESLPPVVYVVGSNDAIGYLRPLRGPGDSNGRDYFQTLSNEPLDLYVYTRGKPLTISLDATPDESPAEKPVTFTATSDADPGTALSYAWSFGDRLDPEAGRATKRHTYTAKGTYRAHVVVTGADGSTGRSEDVVVSIGSAEAGPGPGKGAGDGDGGKGSGDNDSPNAPVTGPDSSDGQKAGGTPSARAQEGAAARSGRPATSSTAAPSRGDRSTPAGNRISGILLSDADAPSSLASDLLASPVEAATAPAARSGGSTSPLGVVASIATVLLLLAAGAARESTWVHHRLHHLRSRHER